MLIKNDQVGLHLCEDKIPGPLEEQQVFLMAEPSLMASAEYISAGPLPANRTFTIFILHFMFMYVFLHVFVPHMLSAFRDQKSVLDLVVVNHHVDAEN